MLKKSFLKINKRIKNNKSENQKSTIIRYNYSNLTKIKTEYKRNKTKEDIYHYLSIYEQTNKKIAFEIIEDLLRIYRLKKQKEHNEKNYLDLLSNKEIYYYAYVFSTNPYLEAKREVETYENYFIEEICLEVLKLELMIGLREYIKNNSFKNKKQVYSLSNDLLCKMLMQNISTFEDFFEIYKNRMLIEDKFLVKFYEFSKIKDFFIC